MSNIDGNDTVLDMKISNLQENIQIKNYKVSGTLKYVENFTKFNESNPAEQKGNFLAIHFDDTDTREVECKLEPSYSAKKGYVKLDEDGIFIAKVASNDQKILVKINGKEVTPLSLTNLELKQKGQ